jgi:superfamily II DNA/RNA helicase
MDIPPVDFVLNYDLPQDSETYIHQVGRTARAGKSGAAISFVTQYDVELWLRIENTLGEKMDEYNSFLGSPPNTYVSPYGHPIHIFMAQVSVLVLPIP